MNREILIHLFEHNAWANQQIVDGCLALSDAQLDAKPASATMGTIRETLLHIAFAQQRYLSYLTEPDAARRATVAHVDWATVGPSLAASSQRLVALLQQERSRATIETVDQHRVEPRVIWLQAINHATEHREQIKSMMSALGIEPPAIDGWDFGFVTGALRPVPSE
ncbi:MAG: DinB family protein [Anaerolineales bacterium]|nr:DinB family protein [Anaerolineales bacterium]MCB9128960.1 DinB family protein [Ardenticatenales bacterium]MCB9172807.1 DinB family protein [Ardenticatenales bacterium]